MTMKWCLSILFIYVFSYTTAQPGKVLVNGGEWTFTQYAANIIKISFKPTDYKRNENISDAVILKPLVRYTIPYRVEGGSAYIGNNWAIRINSILSGSEYNGFRFALMDGEKIFGGGERALPLDRRGYKFNLYNNPWYGYGEGADNLNYSVPFFTSSRGYGLFFDNPSRGYADIGKTIPDVFDVGFVSGELNVYVILGNDYKEILSSYYKLTGTQPLPPRWAMGNLMSRFGYTSQAQAQDIVVKMKAQNIPVDAIIFDLFWFGDSIKGTMGNLAWVDKQRWPDPRQMIAEFKKQQINTILITEPFVVQSSLNYENSRAFQAVDSAGRPYVLSDFYFGKAGLIDIFRKDAQEWFWNKHNVQMKIGVEGWWGDLGEPEKHPRDLYHNLKDMGYNRLFSADEVHNLYGHTWTKMLYNHYATEYPSKRLFSLNRSGFAGSQRFGIFPWSGDVSRSWSGLRAQLPVMLGMSMSGVPYIHADAGGFAGGEGDNELYVRWLQYAAFTPVFRPHGTALYGVEKATFNFPSEAALIDTPWKRYATNAINLRYALLPYNYTLAYKQMRDGEPLVAPLYYHYSKDTTAMNVSDEFMWGESILVAPILQKGMNERKLYLPEGKWYDLFKNDILTGNSWNNINTEIAHIPVYVKEGSFIPMMRMVTKDHTWIQSTADFNSKELDITYYPSPVSSAGELYIDDGITKNGPSELIILHGIKKGSKVEIKIKTNKPQNYIHGSLHTIKIGVPSHVLDPLKGTLNGKPLSVNQISKRSFEFSPDVHYECIEVPFYGKPITLEFTFVK